MILTANVGIPLFAVLHQIKKSSGVPGDFLFNGFLTAPALRCLKTDFLHKINAINMPQSHHKQKTKHHQKNHTAAEKKQKISASTFMAVMGAVFGLSFGWFTSDQSISWTFDCHGFT